MSISLRRRPSFKKRRKIASIGSLFAALIICLIYYSHGWAELPPSTGAGHSTQVPSTPMLNDHARLWRSLFHIILNNDPHCEKKPDVVIPERLDVVYEDNHVHNRPDVLWVDTADVQRLKMAHQNFISDVQLSQLSLVYENGTRGIVTTVSDSRLPILLTQLHMLRATGSSLPVEVFLTQPTALSSQVCATTLVKFNAVCRYYSTFFSKAGTGVEVTSNQYKIFALLFSSFEEVLLLDSDVWPISSPDHLFTYPPFADTGLVLWPDFWYASESPYFFSIAKIDNPPQLHHKPSIESGELMYSKSKHEKSIMLAAYYNYYGPDYYYPLLSQGAPGQGDKETFGSAALALNEDFYWVKMMVTAIGRTDSTGRFLGSAMVQHDPIVDFQHRNDISAKSKPIALKEKAPKVLPIQSFQSKRINKPMFVHANIPKFDPQTIFSDHKVDDGFKASPTRDTNGTYVRCWDLSPEQISEQFGYDIEKRFWDAIRTVACEEIPSLGDKSKKVEEAATCQKVENYIREVFEGK